MEEESQADMESSASLLPPTVPQEGNFSLYIYFPSGRNPRTTTDMISCAILLPSGVGPGAFAVRVLEGWECTRADRSMACSISEFRRFTSAGP